MIQMKIKEGDTEYNFSRARTLLEKAAQNRPDVIMLPETWNTGFFPKDDIDDTADENAVKTKALLSRISREYKVNIVGGSVTEKKDGKFFNTCYVFDDKGNNIASYSKAHLFSPMEENRYYSAGDGICLFTVNGIKAAVMICYDLRFPEFARKAALSGAEVIFVPAQWPKERISQMKILLRARAVENQMFALLCNSCGEAYNTLYGGSSLVCDPLGNTDSAGDGEEILFVSCDTDVIKDIRKSINVFSDRREDIY